MPTTTLVRISPVHGGLAQPVSRITSSPDLAAWSKLFAIDVNDNDRTSLYRVGDGTLSPLTGPMVEADYRTTLASCSIKRGDKEWAWGIPIILPVTDAEAAKAQPGTEVALSFEGKVFGTLTVESVYDWDKAEFIKGVYGTERTDHPGARLWTGDERTKLVGGEIQLASAVDARAFAARVMHPLQTRALIEKKGWEQSVGFQTRNPLHRAHEYALVYGAETILRETGKKTGVVLNPLVGQLKGDDVPADVRMQTYETLVG
jgi:sulfate adenylyltransferase